MKKFRVAKCLEDGKIAEFVIFEDGSKKRIHSDEKYGKYFYVDNVLNNNSKSFLKKYFSGRIADAVQTIKNGDGDTIKCSNFFGTTIHVIYFIDRKIGEELQKKSIERWKDTNFGWTIEFGNKNSMRGYSKINSKGNPLSFGENQLSYQIFSTEEETMNQAESYLEEAKKIATNLIEQNNNCSAMEKDKNIEKIIDDFKEKDELFSIVSEFTFDLLNDECTAFRNSEKKLSEYGFNVIQCIVPTKEEIEKMELKLKAMNLSMTFRIKKDFTIDEQVFLDIFTFFEENKSKFSEEKLLSKMNDLVILIEEDKKLIFDTWKK